MRGRLPVLLVIAALAAALWGCGTAFDLPTETREGRLVPSDHSYQMSATWENMTGINDILLTQGSGTQLFLLFQRPGVGTAPRGEVLGYALRARPPIPPPLGIAMNGVFNPHALCAANGKVFVLDQGDTTLARDPADRKVSDLSVYWRVREYGLLGGDTTSTFTDTSLAYVQGIAADDQGRVYVSGSAIVLLRTDPNNPSAFTRTLNFRVNRYRPVAPGTGADPYMPGTSRWVRDNTYLVEEGSGLGTLEDPRGLYWSGASVPGGPALFAADFGKNWVQKLSDATSSTGIFIIDGGQDTVLTAPTDVALDLKGYIYVADAGGNRVLRFDPNGTFVQKVNVEPDSDHQPLADPVAVAADDSLVYVADRAAAKVVRYERRK